MKQQTNINLIATYNNEVHQAYFKLLKDTERLIGTLEPHELRCTLQQEDKTPVSLFSKVHELVSPLLYLSLQCCDGEKLSIKFGFEQGGDDYRFSHITAKFLRMLYKCTGNENTSIDVEDCIHTDYIIVNCSELYECVEDSCRSTHTFKLIKYKQPATQRKRMLSVA